MGTEGTRARAVFLQAAALVARTAASATPDAQAMVPVVPQVVPVARAVVAPAATVAPASASTTAARRRRSRVARVTPLRPQPAVAAEATVSRMPRADRRACRRTSPPHRRPNRFPSRWRAAAPLSLVGELPPDRGRVSVDLGPAVRQRAGRARAQAAGMSAGTSLRRTRRESLGSTSARYSTGLRSASAQQPSTV